MTSYFEIGGHIVECETTPQSSLSVSRTPMMQSRKAADSRIVGEEARPSSRTARKSDSNQIIKNPYRRMIGSVMIRTGVAILMVPDPLPIIDEVGGAALVYGGIYLHATAE